MKTKRVRSAKRLMAVSVDKDKALFAKTPWSAMRLLSDEEIKTGYAGLEDIEVFEVDISEKEEHAVETYLPIFPGFYETTFSSDNAEEMELENINELREEKGLPDLTWDALDFKYDEYHTRVARACSDAVMSKLYEEGLITAWRYQEISSPKEYNFRNDSVFVEASHDVVTRARLLTKILGDDDGSAFQDYLSERYTSYDGFCSFHSNDIDNWLGDFEESCDGEHKLGSMLEFVLKHDEWYDTDSLYEEVSDQTSMIDVGNRDLLQMESPSAVNCARCGKPIPVDVDSQDNTALISAGCPCVYERIKGFLRQDHPNDADGFIRLLDEAVSSIDHVNIEGVSPSESLIDLIKRR